MQTIYQIDKNDLTEVIANIVRETIQNLPKPKEDVKVDRIDIDEVSLLTGLKIPQIYKLTHRNEIPFKKFGKRLVFSRKEVCQWIDYQTKHPSKKTVIDSIAASAEAKESRAKRLKNN